MWRVICMRKDGAPATGMQMNEKSDKWRVDFQMIFNFKIW